MDATINERRWVVLILALFVLFALAYSVLIPMWEGPDEHAHYLLALNLTRLGIFSSIERNYEAYQPQPYYRFASLVLRPLQQIDPEMVDYYHPNSLFRNVRRFAAVYDWNDDNYRFLLGPQLLRIINVAFGLAAISLNYLAMRRFIPIPLHIPIAALALASLTPQFLHTTSYISNDALGVLAGAFLFFLFSRICLEEIGLFEGAMAATAALILPFTTKLTVLPMGLAVLVALGWRGWGRFRSLPAGRVLLAGGLALTLAAALFVIVPGTGERIVAEIQFRALEYHPEAFTIAHLDYVTSQLIWSYWGKVGWLSVGLPVPAVLLLTALMVVGGIANFIQMVRARRSERQALIGNAAWLLLWIAAGLALLVVGRNGLTTVNNQGRFLYPSIGVLTLLPMAGWYALLPERWGRRLPTIVLILMIAANLLLWLTGVIPVFYQPFLG